jgi:hypothetical protein
MGKRSVNTNGKPRNANVILAENIPGREHVSEYPYLGNKLSPVHFP